MMSVISFFLVVLAGLLAVPVTVLLVEVIAALAARTPNASSSSRTAERQPLAVVVPAHNESTGLLPTLGDIKGQLRARDRLLIVADNCDDDTAAVATRAGAETIERHDRAHIGKGYALDFGIRHLAQNPPTFVIVIDADCRLAAGTIETLAATCAATGRPAQALDLMTAPDNASINYRVAEFAWRVKNWVRPLGLKTLNLPCQLMGTGMAFPWEVIRSANLASGSIVEDIMLGLNLARTGSPPIFCPSASVESHFPLSIEGAQNQRKRWEEGHIRMILRTVPRFIYEAVTRRNLDLLALTIDLAIPPLSLLVILFAGMSIITGSATLFSLSATALAINIISFVALLLAIFLSWLKCGRDVLPPARILAIVPYVFGKLALYLHVLSNKVEGKWIRTDRKNS